MDAKLKDQDKTPANSVQPADTEKIQAKKTESQKIETACRRRIIELIEKQENEIGLANEKLEKNHVKFVEFDKKWDLAKRSLKIAKKKKAAKNTVKLIKDERKSLKASRREYRNLIEAESAGIEAMKLAIEMLKTLI
jgi:hypothetical protein